MSRSCAVAAECSSTHGTGVPVPGVRPIVTQGMPACASVWSCGSFSAGSIRIAASKLTASSGFAPGGTRISACCFSSAIIADVNATSIINPSRDAPEAIVSGTEESRAMVLVLPVRSWRARIFGV
ncbi:hypothetical protein ACFW38_001377 [Salmonella enterica]